MAPRGRAVVMVLLAALATALVGVEAALEVPYLGGRVNDLAGMVSESVRTDLESRLEALEQATGAQVVILTVPSLEGDSLEDFSMRVAETWKLGRRGHDDGVLLLVARDERRIRIEVGYGLEGALTDAESGRIIDQLMRPAFRSGDVAGGLASAVDAIAGQIRGDGELPEAPTSDFTELGLGGQIGFFAVFLAVVGTFSAAALFSPGCGGWFLYLFLSVFWLTFPAAAFGPWVGVAVAALWLLGFPAGRIWLWNTGAGKRFRASNPGWVALAASSSRGSRSGGFSGGFSGGGGSFGGGGASGGW